MEYCHTVTDKFAFSLAFAESIFKKSISKITKYLKKSILKKQNKILFCIFKIKYYFENSILHITDSKYVNWNVKIQTLVLGIVIFVFF